MNPTIEYLFCLQTFGMKFGLRNIRALLRSCGDPHRSIRTIHIAGTNGKGSTSSMIASILTAAGYSVGLYTSPHLISFNERIRINGVKISDNDVVKYVRRLRPEIDRLNATFFEATTAVAFKYFSDQNVDIAVIETGLGGRLDSTNVLRPLVSVITSIGKDHTQYLGTSLRSIAAEKAGIIKRRISVVLGDINGVARATILRRAKIMSAPAIESSKMKIPAAIRLGLKGNHQRKNARAAIAAVAVAARHMLIGDRAVKDGLEQTTSLSGLRARLEYRKGKPDLLLDVAHNPDGIKTLVREVRAMPQKRFIILFGVMKDKDYRSMLKQLARIDPIIIAAQPHGERALSVDDLVNECKKLGIPSIRSKNVPDAFRLAKQKAGESGLVITTGSHYLIGELLSLIEKKP
jgi:dihydrofolate synthase/folylpolyglutamate synthase